MPLGEVPDRVGRSDQVEYPYISEMTAAISHDDASVVGMGCDDQFEFEFALDLMLGWFRAAAPERCDRRSEPSRVAP